mmetsp:Transcript_14361/g.24452  ORF Transcript_14361/g.24452 Transcript_14361/m.24452 type:complete len:146 (-) Transcript_14361:561-998(-)
MDGEHHMKMKYWSLSDEDAPKKIQKLTFTNDSKADLTFNLNINGPFQIVKTKTNSGATHPLSGNQKTQSEMMAETEAQNSIKSTKTTNRAIQPKVETMFCLQPLKIVDVHIKFMVPTQSDTQEWPMTIFNQRKGELVAFFANGDQ